MFVSCRGAHCKVTRRREIGGVEPRPGGGGVASLRAFWAELGDVPRERHPGQGFDRETYWSRDSPRHRRRASRLHPLERGLVSRAWRHSFPPELAPAIAERSPRRSSPLRLTRRVRSPQRWGAVVAGCSSAPSRGAPSQSGRWQTSSTSRANAGVAQGPRAQRPRPRRTRGRGKALLDCPDWRLSVVPWRCAGPACTGFDDAALSRVSTAEMVL